MTMIIMLYYSLCLTHSTHAGMQTHITREIGKECLQKHLVNYHIGCVPKLDTTTSLKTEWTE